MTNTDTKVFLADLNELGIPEPVKEYPFAKPLRVWRADFAWPEYSLIVEIEGGVWTKGRHITPEGFLEDANKYNSMVILGWKLLRFTPQQVRRGIAARWIKNFFRIHAMSQPYPPSLIPDVTKNLIKRCSEEKKRLERKRSVRRKRRTNLRVR